VKITGEHAFAVPREQVWAALHDPRMLAGALPGLRRLEATGPGAYAITVDVGVGSVRGAYDGTFALGDEQAPEACTVRASASGRPGSVETVARMRMEEHDGRARLSYEADATVTGPLAGVGQRLVGGAARRTTEQFLAALEARILEPETAGEAAPGAEPAPGGVIVRPARAAAEPKALAASALAGFALALIGVAVGRWTARR
jgi:carbon monoxide dehydrogenase subunit G